VSLPILTQIRAAVWDAVEANTQLAATIQGRFTWDDSGATLLPDMVPALGDLPALSIYPTSVSTPWLTNQQQMIGMGLEIKLWTPELSVILPELIWQLFGRAVWSDSTGVRAQSTATFIVEDLIATAPANFQRLPLTDDDGDTVTMTQCQWQLLLNVRWNPRTDESLNGTLTIE
jgi:hypothetical protein